jgi:hypothetical protein
METTKDSTTMDWLIFLVSTIIMVALMIYKPAWFWVALPFSTTYLVKALRVI